jgi:Co/Zn/Cd efflux system component
VLLCSVHDLHIWSLSVGKPSLSVHILAKSRGDDEQQLLAAATRLLASEFRIHHTTIQVEKPEDNIDCNRVDIDLHGHAH